MLVNNEFHIINPQNGDSLKTVDDFYEKNKIDKGLFFSQKINIVDNYIIISNELYIIVLMLSKK